MTLFLELAAIGVGKGFCEIQIALARSASATIGHWKCHGNRHTENTENISSVFSVADVNCDTDSERWRKYCSSQPGRGTLFAKELLALGLEDADVILFLGGQFPVDFLLRSLGQAMGVG